MQRFIRGLMLACTAVVAWGCSDDPIGEGADEANRLAPSPNSMFVGTTQTQGVVVEVLNPQGAAIETSFEVVNVSAGITAEIDSTFNPFYNADGELVPPSSPTRTRVLVTGGTVPGNYSFDVVASGLSITVPVKVYPRVLLGDFSSTTPAIPDTVSFTLDPAFTFVEDEVTLDIAGGVEPYLVDVSPDGSTVRFVLAPNSSGTLRVGGVKATFFDASVPTFELPSSVDFTAQTLETFPATFTSPAAPGPLTISTTPDWFFLPEATPSIGFVDVFLLDVAADGSSATILASPSTSDSVRVAGINPATAPFFPDLELLADPPELTVTPIVTLAGTDATGTAPNFTTSLSLGRTGWYDDWDGPWGSEGVRTAKWYQITIAEDGDYDITTDWETGADYDIRLYDAGLTAIFGAETGAHPEHIEAYGDEGVPGLTAGVYYLKVILWAGTAATEMLTTVEKAE